MKEYHKIETVYNRDVDGSKKLIEGDFRNKTVEMLKDVKWIWTEKIDGTNIRIHWDGHNVEIGGRTDKAQIPSDLVNYLTNTFMTPETEELFEQKFGDADVTFYGEGYGKKIQKVGALYRDDVSFILFDAMYEDTWLTRESVEDIATAFGVDVVPVVGYGTIEEAVEFVKSTTTSTVSDKAPMEGVVARPECEVLDRFGRRVIVKIKARDFQ